MSSFSLCGGSDLKCPQCGHGFDIEWDTEYGDPQVGEHEVECCSNCGRSFSFECHYVYNILPEKTDVAVEKLATAVAVGLKEHFHLLDGIVSVAEYTKYLIRTWKG